MRALEFMKLCFHLRYYINVSALVGVVGLIIEIIRNKSSTI